MAQNNQITWQLGVGRVNIVQMGELLETSYGQK